MGLIRRTRNFKRKIIRRKIGYVFLTIKGEIPFFPPKKSFIERQILPQADFSILGFWQDSEQLIKDPRVKGIVIHLSEFSVSGLTDLEFLRDTLMLWKNAGKKVIFYSHHYGIGTYYLASLADKIFLTEGGMLDVTGIGLSINYYKQFLAKFGLEFQISQISPYKSAANFLGREEMPEEEKEMLNWMLDSLFETLTKGIAKGREKSIDEIKEFIDHNPMTDKDAVDQGWVTKLIPIADLSEELSDFPLTTYKHALSRVSIPGGKKRLALLPAVGSIEDGQGNSPFPRSLMEGEILADIPFGQKVRRIIKEKKRYKACILFVNSPGGSATASELMLNELNKLSKVMPIYTYFHSVAGSGGYYIAMASHKIFAQQTTITASIGVLNGKFVRKELLEKQQIKPYSFKRGEHSDINSADRPWNDKEKEIMKTSIERIYELFVSHVMKNRNMTFEEVDSVGRGRVYIAPQAEERRLVDGVLPFNDFLNLVAEEQGMKDPKFKIITVKSKEIKPPLNDVNLKELYTELMKQGMVRLNGRPKSVMFPRIRVEF